MTPNLSQMSNTELKRCISGHRNDIRAFQAVMEVLMKRRNPANRHPYPLELADPEAEVEAIFRERLQQAE